MSSDPAILGAAREILELALDEIRGCVEGAPAEALNWRPEGAETNSIAVLAVHSLHSTRSWLSVAVGAPLPARDRPSEFMTSTSDVSALVAAVDVMKRECVALLETDSVDDWSTTRETHPRPDNDSARQVTAAWALLHALEHLREHTGQMLLTRHLWDARA